MSRIGHTEALECKCRPPTAWHGLPRRPQCCGCADLASNKSGVGTDAVGRKPQLAAALKSSTVQYFARVVTCHGPQAWASNPLGIEGAPSCATRSRWHLS